LRDTKKQLRAAVFATLDGVISVPVYDEKKKVTETDTLFVILSTQQETPTEENDCTWIKKSSIDLVVYQKTGSEVSKDDIDDVANEILVLLLPSVGTSGAVAPSGLQFSNAYCESNISRDLSISETESIVANVVRFSVTIMDQN